MQNTYQDLITNIQSKNPEIAGKLEGGKARYEEVSEGHHDHLIDVNTGEIIEFVDDEIEKLQKKVAEKYGYNLVDHKLELYGIKKKS